MTIRNSTRRTRRSLSAVAPRQRPLRARVAHRTRPRWLAAPVVFALWASSSGTALAATQQFNQAGDYTFTVPYGVHTIAVTAVGGWGGDQSYAHGGAPAVVTGNLDVSPGEALQVTVAEDGQAATIDASGASHGGLPNGGFPNGAGGGGASEVSTSGGYTSFGATPLLVAGGGGGAGGDYYGILGGSGGDAVGYPDPSSAFEGTHGGGTGGGDSGWGGSPTAGGAGGQAGSGHTYGLSCGSDAASGSIGQYGSGGAGGQAGRYVGDYHGNGLECGGWLAGGGGGGGGGLNGGGGGGGGGDGGDNLGTAGGGGGGGGGSSLIPQGGSAVNASSGTQPYAQIDWTSVAAPTITTPPKITGAPIVGATLTVQHGTWSQTPEAYGYRWMDCEASRAPTCLPIDGTNGLTSYTPTSTDVGYAIAVYEWAVFSEGTVGPASSVQTEIVTMAVPSPTSPPSITGTVEVGYALKVTNGSWTGDPSSFAHAWESCDASGGSCQVTSSGTGETYIVTSSDEGRTLKVIEWATNEAGKSGPAVSLPTPVVPAPPSNTTRPALGGVAAMGQALTANVGAWSGSPQISYSIQWQRCNPDCADISAATGTRYTATNQDVGYLLRVVVTATGPGGVRAAISPEIGPVTGTGQGPAVIERALEAQITPSGNTATLERLLQNSASLRFDSPSAGRLTTSWYYLPPGAHMRALLVARGSHTFHTPGIAEIAVRLTTAGRRLLTESPHVRLLTEGAFVTPAGRRIVIRRPFVLTGRRR